MSNSFQTSIISNEPPPLDDLSSEDESEEFRTPGLKLDVFSAEPSPFSTPRKIAKECVDLELEHSTNTINIPFNDLSIENIEENSATSYESFDHSPTTIPTNTKFSITTAEELEDVEENPILIIPAPVETELEVEEDEQIPIPPSPPIQYEGDSVGAIIVNIDPDPNISNGINANVVKVKDNEVEEEQNQSQEPIGQDRIEEEEFTDDDDFGDFASTTFTEAVPHSTGDNVSHQQDCNTNEDDFADFQDFEEAVPPQISVLSVEDSTAATFKASSSSNSRMSADFSAALELKFETLIKSMIPTEDEKDDKKNCSDSIPRPFNVLDKELKDSQDLYWNHVLDFEESRALLFKWLNCSYQQKLYKSLNIDTTTIVYTEKWGAIEVPRFAACLGESPILQPQQISSVSGNGNKTKDVSVPLPSIEPRNYVQSDITENADSISNIPKPTISKEAQQILQKIPDLSFMTSKTLVFPQTSTSSSAFLQ